MIKGNFTRLASTSNPALESIALGWFALSHRWLEDKQQRRKLHGTWFRITCEGRRCYRAFKMVASLKGSAGADAGDICVDWSAWLSLDGYNEKPRDELYLEIEPASWVDIPAIALSHPDPAHRVAAKFAILSVGLGILSLVVAFF
jgi:hypothetical protein